MTTFLRSNIYVVIILSLLLCACGGVPVQVPLNIAPLPGEVYGVHAGSALRTVQMAIQEGGGEIWAKDNLVVFARHLENAWIMLGYNLESNATVTPGAFIKNGANVFSRTDFTDLTAWMKERGFTKVTPLALSARCGWEAFKTAIMNIRLPVPILIMPVMIGVDGQPILDYDTIKQALDQERE